MGADPVHRRVHKDGLLKAGRICIFVTAILTPGFGALLAFARVCHLARIRVTTAVRLIVREEVKHQAETHVDPADLSTSAMPVIATGIPAYPLIGSAEFTASGAVLNIFTCEPKRPLWSDERDGAQTAYE